MDQASRDAAQLPIFDEPTMLARLDGDRGLARDIVGVALEQIPAGFAALDAAIGADRWPEVQRAAHTLKGQVAQIGGTRLAAQLTAVDARLKRGERIDAAEAAALQAEFAVLARALHAAFP